MTFASFIEALKVVYNLITAIGPLIVKLISPLVEYIILIRNRVRNAYEDEVKAKAQAKEEQAEKEKANVIAFKSIVEDAWKIRYNDILNFINIKQYDRVIALRKEVDNPSVDNVLFDFSLSNEYKAMKIVEIMRKQKT
jgi:hypothetical protein